MAQVDHRSAEAAGSGTVVPPGVSRKLLAGAGVSRAVPRAA
jgi:hypothetical protein